MKKSLELLRALEEFDLITKDLSHPDYKKLGFGTGKDIVDLLKSIELEREKIKKRIDKKILMEYERIKKRYRERIIVQVIKGFCGGCYVRLPSDIVGRCLTEVLTCPHCGRFLYCLK